MGASEWTIRVPFRGTLDHSLADAQRATLKSGEYVWPWDDGADGSALPVPRPTSWEALAQAKLDEEFWEEGTHSILDMNKVASQDDIDEFAAITPLSHDEQLEVFATVRPTVSDLERINAAGSEAVLAEYLGPKWSGRCVVLYAEDDPAEVLFWGWSGD